MSQCSRLESIYVCTQTLGNAVVTTLHFPFHSAIALNLPVASAAVAVFHWHAVPEQAPRSWLTLAHLSQPPVLRTTFSQNTHNTNNMWFRPDSPVVSVVAVPELAPCPWTVLAHLSQPPAVRTTSSQNTHHLALSLESPVVSVAVVSELAPCPWPLFQPPAVRKTSNQDTYNVT